MLTDYHAKSGDGYDPAKLIEVLKELNRKIGDHHYEVGIVVLPATQTSPSELPDVWRMEIEPYLEEYFFDQQATVDAFRWDEVKKKLAIGRTSSWLTRPRQLRRRRILELEEYVTLELDA